MLYVSLLKDNHHALKYIVSKCYIVVLKFARLQIFTNFYKVVAVLQYVYFIFFIYIHIYLLYIFSAVPQIVKSMLIGLYLLE
jgi:hypothetical protein